LHSEGGGEGIFFDIFSLYGFSILRFRIIFLGGGKFEHLHYDEVVVIDFGIVGCVLFQGLQLAILVCRGGVPPRQLQLLPFAQGYARLVCRTPHVLAST